MWTRVACEKAPKDSEAFEAIPLTLKAYAESIAVVPRPNGMFRGESGSSAPNEFDDHMDMASRTIEEHDGFDSGRKWQEAWIDGPHASVKAEIFEALAEQGCVEKTPRGRGRGTEYRHLRRFREAADPVGDSDPESRGDSD